jgi:type VI protein secretion system component VasK
MDFFRPSTGTYWGFYDRVLSPYIVKTTDGWMVRSLGSVNIQFNPLLARSLAAAERIREIFFKPDGTVRALMLTVSPVASNTKTATLTVNGQGYELSPKVKQVQVTWPSESKPQGAALKVQVSADFAQDLSYPGAWGLLKLIGGARVAKMSESAFSAKWEVNVQNMYVVQQSYRVQVGSADNPFVDRVFEQFECPTDIVKAGERRAAAQ